MHWLLDILAALAWVVMFAAFAVLVVGFSA
jgi:hypothetical protein